MKKNPEPPSINQTNELRQRAEALHSQRKSQKPLTQIDSQRLIHELQVHQIELEMQNEELRQMQVQLEAAHSKYCDLFDFAPVGYLTINEQGLILEANLTAAKMLGVARSHLISQSLTGFILPEHQDADYLHRQALFASDIPQTYELRMYKNGAIPFWARLEASLPKTEGRTPVCHIAVSDISEQKQTEMALRDSEEKYRVIFENEIYAICIFDLGTLEFLDVNDAFVRLYGYSREELLSGMTIHDITTEHQASDAATNQAVREGTLFIPLRFHQKKGGEVIPVEIVGGPYTWKGHKVMFALMHEISDRIRAEDALRESTVRLSASEQTLRQIFQISPVGIAISLPETGLILDTNEAFAKMFGFTLNEVIGKTSRELNLFGSWENRQIATAGSLRNGFDRNVRSQMQRKDGSPLLGLASVETIQYQGQTCLLSAVVDITELEQMHATLLETQKMAGLGTLVAGLAHEMNSPLQVITGSVDDLLKSLKKGDPVAPEHMEKYLGYASRNAWRIAEIIRALMIYAHPIKIKTEVCDINHLVQDSVLLTQNQFKHSNTHIQLTLEEGLPTLQCEASDLVQSLVALLKNAGDALAEGGQIALTSAYDAAHEEIKLTVEDNGVGIEPENLDKIFDPFFTTKSPGQGVGLGLTVVQGVVRKYGWRIKVESVPGKGSAFHLYFPLKDTAAEAENPFKAEGRYAEIRAEKRENT